MAKKTIEEQIEAAEKHLRNLKEKQVREAQKRKASRYDTLVKSVPDIDGYTDDEFADFARRLAQAMATSTDVLPTPSK